MKEYIEKGALYDKTAAWEASALKYIAKLKLNKTSYADLSTEERAEWLKWTAILGERSAFKFDVADAPTVDAVEVVRCKDCKYHDEGMFGAVYCPNLVDGWVSENFFCAGGERSENEEH